MPSPVDKDVRKLPGTPSDAAENAAVITMPETKSLEDSESANSSEAIESHASAGNTDAPNLHTTENHASASEGGSGVRLSRTRAVDAKTNNIATVALLAALALIFSYVEAIIPYNPGIPGIKLGVANIVAVVALYNLSAKHAAAVNFIRILVAGLLFNGLFGALYSLAGAVVSLAGMILLKRTDKFSIAGVSMAGGVLHNLGQLMIAALLLEDSKIFLYFPVLLFSGIVSGIVIGLAAHVISERLKKSM